MRARGLRQRMLLIGAAATLPVLLAMGVLARAALNDSLEVQKKQVSQLLGLASTELELRVLLEERLLKALALAPSLARDPRNFSCARFLTATAATHEQLARISLRTPGGELICASSAQDADREAGIAAEYLADPKHMRRMFIADRRSGSRGDKTLLTLVLPVTDERGKTQALLTSSIDLRFLEEQLAKMQPQAQTNIVLVNAAGTILSPPRWAGQSVADHAVMKRVAKVSDEVSFETVGIDGVERVFAARPVRSTVSEQLHLWVAASRSDIVSNAISQFAKDTLSLTLMMLALVVALWHYGNKLVLRPLVRLRQAASHLGKAQLAARTGLEHSDDEIGQLAASFDAMADQLEHHVQRIAEDLLQIRAAAVTTKKLSRAIEQSPAIVVITNTRGVIEYVNPQFTTVTGYAAAEAIGRTPAILKSGLTPDGVYATLWSTLLAGQQWRGALLNRKKNGDLFWEETRISPLMDEHGCLTHFIAIKEDVTERRRAEEALRLLKRAIEASSNGVIMVKSARQEDNPIIYTNPAFERIMGYAQDEVLGCNVRVLFNGELGSVAVEKLRDATRRGMEAEAVVRAYAKDGTARWISVSVSPVRDEDGRLTHFVNVFSDVSERVGYELELQRQANHDSLTGLANRNLLADRLAQAIAQAHRAGHAVAVLMVDLDNFKVINDSLGHAAGDMVVKAVAQRLALCVREGDTVARMGGDEFVLVMHNIQGEVDATAMMQRIVASIATPFVVEAHELHVTCSLGAAIYPKDGGNSEELLRNADTAMYRAKEQGRDSFRFYTSDMNLRLMERLNLEAELRLAIDREVFQIHYQAQVDTATQRVVGAEALARWPHERLGMIPPARFIPLAEETGLIVTLGEWLLRKACMQARSWERGTLGGPRLAVNISARQFRQKDFVSVVARALADSGLDPDHLELELTESMVMSNPDEAVVLLHDLKALGVHLALDDFGTGYSSLNYLKRFPIDVLKLDQSFVRGVLSDSDDAAIARSVIALAHSLNLRVVAEGVESEEQRQFLSTARCDIMQGYHFSRPLPAADFAALLQSAFAWEDQVVSATTSSH